METPYALHEDAFYEYFKPFRHPDAQYEIWGGHGLETFGKDFEIVRNYDPAYVWTVVDGDSGNSQWITTGIHYVNRVCYLITVLPHKSALIEFRIGPKSRSLTSLGLKRQLLKLKRLMSDIE